MLALLLLVAGCVGSTGPTDVEIQTTVEPTTNATPQTSERATTQAVSEGSAVLSVESATNVSQSLSELDSTPRYDPDGDLNATKALTRHVLALGTVESVTINSTTRTVMNSNRENASVTQSLRQTSGSEEFFWMKADSVETARYTSGNQSYLKNVWGNETTYSRVENVSMNTNTREGLSVLLVSLEFKGLWAAPYDRTGTVTQNGETLIKYEATSPGYYAKAARGNNTLESFSGTLLVDQNGLIRAYDERIVITRDGVRMVSETSVQYTAVGTTHVQQPEWVETAKQSPNKVANTPQTET